MKLYYLAKILGIAAFSVSLSALPVNLIFIEDIYASEEAAKEQISQTTTTVQEKANWVGLGLFSLLGLLLLISILLDNLLVLVSSV